jgi:hypothetical protein
VRGWRSRSRAIVLAAALSWSAIANAEEPAAPSPLVLTVTPGSAGGPWKLRLENTGDLPLRVVADARLLVMDLTRAPQADGEEAPKKVARRDAKELRCALPAGARPSSDDGPSLVIPGKRSWSVSFDPLFHCFGARERAALVSGTTVRASFGFAPPKARAGRATTEAGPYVAEPVGAAIGKLMPMKRVESATFTLTEPVTVLPPPDGAANAGGAPAESSLPTKLSVSMPEALDVPIGREVAATVTVTNEGERSTMLLFRKSTVQFKVSGPAGSIACGKKANVKAPIRELFTTLGKRGRAQMTLLVTAICPPGTFDEPGVYRLFARVDTTNASGRSLGLRTWDGEAEAKRPLLLRIQRPHGASAATKRPGLD